SGREVEVTIRQGCGVAENLMHVFGLEEVEALMNLVERLACRQEFQQLLCAEPISADTRLPAEFPRLHGQPVEAENGVSHGLSIRGRSSPCSMASWWQSRRRAESQ